jgi:hypothetical protein
VNTPVGRQWFSSRHVTAATDTHGTIEELLKVMFSVRSVPRLLVEEAVSLEFERVRRSSSENCSQERVIRAVSPDTQYIVVLLTVTESESS